MDQWFALLCGMLWSFSPIGEMKLGLSYALLHQVPIFLACFFCMLANIAIFPFFYFGIQKIKPLLKNKKKWNRYSFGISKKIDRFVALNQKPSFQKYVYWSLFSFVALPLPGTGVYSASLLVHTLDLKFYKSLAWISFGIGIQAVLICWLIELGKKGYQFFLF